MFSFVKLRPAIEQESHKIVDLVRSGLPVSSEHRIRDWRLTAKSATTVRQIAGSAAQFAREHNAGIVSRSYLANCVRWGLKDLGYCDAFVDRIIESIVIAMHRHCGE